MACQYEFTRYPYKKIRFYINSRAVI